MSHAQVTLQKRKMAFYNGKKAKPDLIAQALRALAMILKVGESETRALEVVGDQFRKYDIGRAFSRAAETMRTEGAGFKQAMLAEDVLPRTVRELITAAPNATSMHKNLVQAAKLITQGQSVKKKLLISLIQPGFMFAMGLTFMFVATTWIIPGFVSTFSVLNAEVPELTLIVVAAAEVTKWVIGSVIALVLLVMLFWFTIGRRITAVRALVDRLTLKLPAIGPIVRFASTSRMFELLSTNLLTGMAEPDALESAGSGAGNDAIQLHSQRHANRMRQDGARLSEFADSNLLPENAKYMLSSAPSVIQMIEIMSELGPEYRSEANLRLDQLQKTLEPIVNWFVYLIIGVLIIAVMIPMYAMFPALMELSDGGTVNVDPGLAPVPGQ